MLLWLMNLGFAGSDAGASTAHIINPRPMLINISRGGI